MLYKIIDIFKKINLPMNIIINVRQIYRKLIFIPACFFSLVIMTFSSCGQESKNNVLLPGDVQVHDDRLELSLVAEDPDIVTPIGIAVDSKDRLYILNSHTHTPLMGYEGPDGDKIK